MRLLDRKGVVLWLVLGLLAALALGWLYPRLFPYRYDRWAVSKGEAVDIALERLLDLGDPIDRPYVTASLISDQELEVRLITASGAHVQEGYGDSRLSWGLHYWLVRLYERGAPNQEWSYEARVALDGTVTGLRRGTPLEREGPTAIPLVEARLRAGRFLEEQGIDLADYHAPVDRTIQREQRNDLYLRYLDRERLLGDDLQYGVEVRFSGSDLSGFTSWSDDPAVRDIAPPLQRIQLFQTAWLFIIFLLVPCSAIAFVRRYHEGHVGVSRGVQVFALVFGSLAIVLLLTARGAVEGSAFGTLTRGQTTWVWIALQLMVYIPAVATLAFIGWSLGESLCRGSWRSKLAAADAVFRGSFLNGTVASSALRGSASGLAIAAALLGASFALSRAEVAAAPASFLTGPWWEHSALPGVGLLLICLAYSLTHTVFGYLLPLPWLVDRVGRWPAAVIVAVATALVFAPPLLLLPVGWGVPLWIAASGALVALFLRYDILTVFLASLVSTVVLGALPLLTAIDPGLQFQGWLACLVSTTPLWLSLRRLGSQERFTYAWDDVPPHVRRIAERERQRVELETARRIQSSILPELPATLAGVALAYRYLPATEVGGDFYDVLALEDGRLSVAIGDVAGHGVSSGLVMSMARSALAVQVSFQPEVEAVFRTLNRVVYQSARQRLLTTLCYALIDPQRRELIYASAGHLYPYRVSTEGDVHALESVAYPLGVRSELDIEIRRAKLGEGDSIFLSSDGLVEACRIDSEEMFGFDRLEESLARHAYKSAEGIVGGVLDDLDDFVGNGAPPDPHYYERADDLTVLVLTLPRAS